MPYDVTRIRSRFPALASGTAHFDGPGGSQVPDVVAQAVASTLTSSIANRGSVTAAARLAEGVVQDCRTAVGDLLGSDPRGVVLGRSATDLTFLLARALARRPDDPWVPGDEVVVTRLDHDANVRPWVLEAERAGATVRVADLDPVTGELPVDAVIRLVSDRTRLVAVTGASNLIGTRPDLAAIAEAVHARPGSRALLHVDAVHLVPHAAVDRAALGADTLTCSPYKFCGPHLGILAGDPDLLGMLHPDKLTPSPEQVPERFELGTLPYELLAGTTAAVDFLADLVPGEGSRRERLVASLATLEQYEDELAELLDDGLTRLGVRTFGSAEHRTPTRLFTVDGVTDADLVAAMAEAGVNTPAGHFYAPLTSAALGRGQAGAVRAGIAPYTTEEEVDRLLDVLTRAVATR